MLFDLRGRGRRRTMRVIYGSLAVLFGAGLVLFGVGAGFGGGGILSSLSKEGEGSGGPNYSAEIKKYSKLTAAQPHDFAAWEKLIKAQLLQGGGEKYETAQGVVTSKGKTLFGQIAESWSGYVAQSPPQPNLELAKRMLTIYGVEGLNKPASEVEVLQTIVAAEPTNKSYYAFLADYAYKAKNTRVGDLASEKAVALAPAAERSRLKKELAEVKTNPTGEKVETITTNGKTYAGKLNSEGKIPNAVEVKKTPAKPGKASSTGTTSVKK
jgi:hypothetical protein